MTYDETFKRLRIRNEKALIPFAVIGDPDYETSLEIIKTLIDAGADILELGFPFSDPVADGPTIQAADQRALKSGINTDLCFRMIKEIREFCDIPIGLLVYANLVYQKGIENFYNQASLSSVNSVLIADVPVEESALFTQAADKNKIECVFIVSPLSEGKNLSQILQKCSGFVYLVSRLGTTGAKNNVQKSTFSLIRRIKAQTGLPVSVGFGVSKPEHVRRLAKSGADGIIVGSALVKIIEQHLNDRKEMLNHLRRFVSKLKSSTRELD